MSYRWPQAAALLVASQVSIAVMPLAMAEPLEETLLAAFDGLEVWRVRLADENGTTAHIATVDLRLRDVHLIVPTTYSESYIDQKALGDTGLPITGYLFEHHALAVLSGGCMKDFFPPLPLGYVQVDGEQLNREHPSDALLNGVMCIAPGRAIITKLDEPLDRSVWRDCLQAGPLLVANGTNVLPLARTPAGLVDKSYDRAFVGISADQQLVLGVIDSIRLDNLSELLVRGELALIAPLEYVLGLPGWTSAGLAWRTPGAEGVTVAGHAIEFLANAIAVR